MTKQSKLLLKSLVSFSDGEECIICFLDDTSCFCFDDDINRRLDYSKFSREIHGMVKYLVDEGCLVYSYDGNPYSFQITHKGFHYRQISWLQIRSFLFRSILTPVLVSFFTTLLTLLIRWLL